MNSESTTHKSLLAIEPYKFTGREVGELRDKNRGQWYESKPYLPEYCIKDDGTIGWSENYHQFTGEHSNVDKEFIFFDIYTADKLLQEELANSGFEGNNSLLSKIVDWEQIVTNIIKNHFQIYNYDDYKRSVLTPQYIVIQLHYYRCSYEYNEWYMEVDILGYLDKDLNLKDYNHSNFTEKQADKLLNIVDKINNEDGND